MTTVRVPRHKHRGYRILPGYRGGIGLQMIVDADVLSRDVIEAAIRDFQARGERRWFSSKPAEVTWTNNFHCKPIAALSV